MTFLFAVAFTVSNLNAATYTVINSNDAGAGSLRQTIAEAASGDTIIFAADVNHIILTSGQIAINKSLTIDGGSDTSLKVTIDGNNNSMIFNISVSSTTVNINNLIFTRGNGRSGSETGTGGLHYGGAIEVSSSSLVATNCIFINNTTRSHGGAVFN